MLKIIATGADSLFFTGDQHFDHGNIIKFCHRPFLGPADQAELARRGGKWHQGDWKSAKWKVSQDSINLMNDTLIDNINRTVPANGVLIHVGDFSMVPKEPKEYVHYANRCQELRDRINCKRIFITWGNHDQPQLIQHLFQWSGLMAKIHLNRLPGWPEGLDIIICHYMMGVWDNSHRAALHVYGHSHADVEEGADQALPGRRSMDVGVDNAARLLGEYRPFQLKEVLDHLLHKPGFGFNPDIPQDYRNR